MSSTQTLSTLPERLAEKLPGKVSLPFDAGYDAARQAWNLAVDQRPAMVVHVETEADAVEAVTFAGRHGLPVAVQGTGHGLKRAADGVLLINTSRLRDVRVDPQARTARLGGGVKWGPVLEQAQQHGLAPLLGSSPDVGAVGYTLGGGFGWLARKYGLSADSVLSLDVVTADGVLRRAGPSENSDLFWALRGGGGGFGVVTGMEIRLYPVGEVYAGNLFYPAGLAGEVFRRFRQWVEDAPDELTASIVLMNYPPLPQVPEPLRGQSFVIVRGCYAGSMEDGQALLGYWRGWQAPLIDDFKPLPFARSAEISRDPLDPGPYPMTGAWLSDLDAGAAEVLIRHTLPQGGPPPIVFSEVRLAGGAVARADPASAAYTHRAERFLWSSIAVAPDPAAIAQTHEHFARMQEALAPHLSGNVFMNFVEGAEARRRTRDGFSAPAFRRLQAVKAKYDPHNLFDYAFDIPPESES